LGQVVFARSGFFARLFKNVATSALRRHRRDFSDTAALPIGDVLLYQTRGAAIRKFIRDKIAESPLPVTLVAHSLGGIACVDLLAMPDPPRVTGLVTIGSQSPLLYEIGVLTSMQPPADLPQSFPPWLNIFDLNDFLSYVAKPLFERATDLEVDSGQPFPGFAQRLLRERSSLECGSRFHAEMSVIAVIVGIDRYDYPDWNVTGPCANAIAVGRLAAVASGRGAMRAYVPRTS